MMLQQQQQMGHQPGVKVQLVKQHSNSDRWNISLGFAGFESNLNSDCRRGGTQGEMIGGNGRRGQGRVKV
eukprot:scaffold154722_cov36-Cyclotella_meneghiniana.AAC.9